ncbi:MAG: hypothetical protein AB7S38_28170 [Vulcanimicrobiota bacterium]
MRRLVIFVLLLSQLGWADDVASLVTDMRGIARDLIGQGAARQEYEEFVKRHQLKALSYPTYIKNKLAFEATRDAGLWHIGYRITDEEPNSDQIWRQWRQLSRVGRGQVTAQAECDELSALYAFLARKLGVNGVGLFWPTSNHTVAVWQLTDSQGSPVRVVVPTTPIFLGRHDGFDARGFDPWKQEVIYEYGRGDAPDDFPLAPGLTRFFLQQLRDYGGASQKLLHELRYLRQEAWLGKRSESKLSALERHFTSSPDQRAIAAFRRSFP